MEIRVRAKFVNGQQSESAAEIIGNHQLLATVKQQSSDSSSVGPLTKKTMQEADEELQNLDVYSHQDFAEALSGVINFAELSLRNTIFEDPTINESEFHEEVMRALDMILDKPVDKGTERTGGPTDIIYNNDVVIELKVEKQTSRRKKLVENYTGQPAQYTASSNSPLAIVAVLDLTEKENPPSSIENEIRFKKVDVHGFEDEEMEVPTGLVFVFFNGNLRNPSEYS